MPLVTNLSTSSFNLTGITGFDTAGASYLNTALSSPHKSIHYAQDSTAIAVALSNPAGATFNLNVIAISDDTFSNVSTSNVKVSTTYPITTILGRTGTELGHTLLGSTNNSRVRLTSFALDPYDNIYVVLVSNTGTFGGSDVIKILKPSEGWEKWTLSNSQDLIFEILNTQDYTSYPNRNSTTFNPGSKARGVHMVHYVHNVQNSGKDYLVTFYQSESMTTDSIANYIFYDIRNVINGERIDGSYLSTTNFSNTCSNNALTYCFETTSQFGAGGIFVSDVSNLTSNTLTGSATFWQVDVNGIMRFSASNALQSLVNGNNAGPSIDNSAPAANAYQCKFIDDRRVIFFHRNNGSTEYRIGMFAIRWNGSNLNDGPGLTNTPSSQLIQSALSVSGTGGTFASFSGNTNGIDLQVFRENQFLRITNFARNGYYDVPYTISGVTTPFPDNSYAWTETFVNQSRGNSFSPSPVGDKDIYLHGPGLNSSLQVHKLNHQKINPITFLYPTSMPAANTMLTSPTTSSINSASGIKVTIQPPKNWITADGLGYSYYNKFMPNIIGYKLKRITGETTDYFDGTTRTFITSETNNNNTVGLLALANYDITSENWTNGSSYDFKFAPNFTIGNQSVYGDERTLATTIPSETPTTPTIRRIMRRSFPNLSESHEYTFDNNTVVNRISISNWDINIATVSIRIGDFYILAPVEIAPGSTLNIDTSQKVDANDRILLSSTSSSVDLWITGTEGI
jgi:hypothetical protein